MSSLEKFPLVIEMNKDKETIESFVLETDKGTKRMKNRFYQQASTDRNNLVEARIEYYKGWLENINTEIAKRYERLMPTDCSETYTEVGEKLSNYLDLIILDSNCEESFKLKLDYILSSINDMASLERVNEQILKFIEQFKSFGIQLTIKDFNYTMFTEEYMNSFLKNHVYESMREIFEDIYFKCPDIKLQLKMNLRFIINKYKKQLTNYVNTLKTNLLKDNSITSEEVYSKYVHLKKELEERKASDEFYNIKTFLDGTKKISDYLENAPTRVKNYNTFVIDGDFSKYSDDDKRQFNTSIRGLYYTLNELKDYFRFEPLLKDLIEIYKNKASAKGEYQNKKKELSKEEKTRLTLYKKYCKASGKGFLAKKNSAKQKSIILQMNQQIRKLDKLYQESFECDIKYKVSLLPESASIYDLLLVSISSFPFLEKWFLNEEFVNLSLEENINKYLDFIYHPDNDFLFKTMVFSEYDITKIIADKYHLLGLNVPSEAILLDQIDSTLETVRFIYLIQSIGKSKVSIETIANICKMNEIISKENA